MEEKFLENMKEAMEIDDRNISMTDNFREFEEWDSLANLSVVAMIDEEYGVVINADEFASIKSLSDLWARISKGN